MKLVSTRQQLYRTRRLQAGDEIETDGREAKILLALGRFEHKRPDRRRTKAVTPPARAQLCLDGTEAEGSGHPAIPAEDEDGSGDGGDDNPDA